MDEQFIFLIKMTGIKLSAVIYSYLLVYVLLEVPREIFPEKYFDIGALAYGFAGAFAYSSIVFYRKIKDLQEGDANSKPLHIYDLWLFLIKSFGSAGLAYVLTGLLFAYMTAKGNSVENKAEVTIILGIGVGFLFEFFTTKNVWNVLSKGLMNILKGFVNKFGGDA